MSLIFRLARKDLGPKILRYERSGLLSFARPVNLTSSTYIQTNQETHEERNARLGRPQSPHLTIYRPQLTSMLSISHRATGMVLSAYTVAFGLGALYLDSPIDFYIEQFKAASVGPACIFGIKFSLAFPMTYHFFNGIRHLFWDTGRFLTIKEVYTTGWIMLASAVISALVLSGYS